MPLPPTVRRLGWLHFANDFTLDFVTPLLPVGVPVAWLGVMEGVADGVAQVLKLVTGRASDRTGRRAGWVQLGYGTNALIRPLAGIGLMLGWPLWVVCCRIGDRLGKGLRGSASDALIADWVSDADRARAYAHMRTMDHLGATLGALAAAGAVLALLGSGDGATPSPATSTTTTTIGWLVLALMIPAAAMLWWCRGLRDTPATNLEPRTSNHEPRTSNLSSHWLPSDRATNRLLVIVAIAGIGSRVGPLLILAHVAGVGDPATAWPLYLVCLGWGALALVQAGASAFAGWATERLGAQRFLIIGWLVGAVVFAALALLHGAWLLVAGLGWGVLTGFTEGAEKTAIAAIVPRHERATAFGMLGLLSAIAVVIGSTVVGFGLAHWGGGIFWVPAAVMVVAGVGMGAMDGSRRLP